MSTASMLPWSTPRLTFNRAPSQYKDCFIRYGYFHYKDKTDGLVQDCSNSSALAMELLQCCTKPSRRSWTFIMGISILVRWHRYIETTPQATPQTHPAANGLAQYKDAVSHCWGKTIVRSSYHHNGNSYYGKMASLFWNSPHVCFHSSTVLFSQYQQICDIRALIHYAINVDHRIARNPEYAGFLEATRLYQMTVLL